MASWQWPTVAAGGVCVGEKKKNRKENGEEKKNLGRSRLAVWRKMEKMGE